MGKMSNLDLIVREINDIPDEEETKAWCEKNGLDYEDEIFKAFNIDKHREKERAKKK